MMSFNVWFNKSPRALAMLLTALLALSACGDDNPKTFKSNNTSADVNYEQEDVGVKEDTTNPPGKEDAGNVADTEQQTDSDHDCQNPTTYYADNDDDGFGDDSNTVQACEPPETGKWVTIGGDCDDNDPDVNPDADEVCDGIDNNCDGNVDTGNIVPRACELNKGVCSGAMTTTCEDGDYKACDADDFGPDYTDAADEDRKCDGLDNNCSGTADTVCCGIAGNRSEPVAVTLGNGSDYVLNNFGPSRPVVIEAANNAPAEATALVVWDESPTRLVAQHIDRDGKPVGNAYNLNVNAATAATVVATPLGYDLIWGESYGIVDGETSYKIFVQALKPNLTAQGSKILLQHVDKPDGKDQLTELSASYQDRGVVIGTNSVSFGGIAKALLYRIDDRANSVKTLDLGGTFLSTVYIRTFSIDSGLLVAWYLGKAAIGSTPASFNGKLYSSTGIAKGSFKVELPSQQGSQFDLIQTSDDEILVVYPKANGVNRVLVAATINLSSGDLVDQVDLTNATASHLAPAIAARDTNNDGFPDETTIIWSLKGPSSTTLVGSSFDARNPALLTSESVIAPGVTNLDNTDIVITGNSTVAVWQTRGTNQKIKTAPVSLEGHGLCL